MSELNIVIDKTEEAQDDKGKRYVKVTDKAGVTRNFKEGRNNLLTNKEHLLEEGKAIKIFLRDYTNPEGKKFPYVYDFEPIAGLLEQQATARVQGQVSRDREDSIEAQVAYKGIIDLCAADKLKVNDPEVQSAIVWAITRLGGTHEAKPIQKGKGDSSVETGQPPDEGAGADDSRGGEEPEWADQVTKDLGELKWKDATVKSYIGNVFHVDTTGTVIEVLQRLDDSQRELFFNEIKARRLKTKGG